MIGRIATAAIAGLLCWSGAVRAQQVDLLGTLYCIPDLPPDRVVAEFSRLLDRPDCAWTMVTRNIETYVLAIEDCRSAPAVPGSDRCQTFVFRISNRGETTPRARGPRFAMRGSGRWCHRISGGWYPDEPDRIAAQAVESNGPQLSDAKCSMPEGWGRREVPVVASVAPPADPPASRPPPTEGWAGLASGATPGAPPPGGPLVIAPPSIAPQPPPSITPQPPTPVPPVTAGVRPPRPLCRTTHAGVCADLVKLRYLADTTASDDDLRRAVGEFLEDERRPAVAGSPSIGELERSTAAAIARSRDAPTCPPEPSAPRLIVACGKS